MGIVGGIGGNPPVGQRPITNAEKQARWRLRHDRRRCAPSTPPGSGAKYNWVTPEMIVNCIPRANVDLDELVTCGCQSMALYKKMLARVDSWLDNIDDNLVTPAEVVKAYAMLAPVLESIAIIRGKIADQRAAEAEDVTRRTDLETFKSESGISETLRLMRDKFSEVRVGLNHNTRDN